MKLEDLGSKLKELRKEKNLTQEQLEEYSSITKKTISKMENGFNDEVGIKKVETILDLLGYEFSIRLKNRPRTLEELQEELENE
ncbi:helix-turn-helix domain-containing protein [Poseidonibacter ostreae]|uniref:Helix-turn-helix domain-containing protein n=1 Tax=Poseidonibacter ostreae TaxID=2654171 RepID=A0A6L4WRE1_9BACT|nr:helix-turn-helix transcriptional regulator [Poseidonibacter ostreae]KAB7884821.1 helix-turn-helix domain-containing protein [Poseidonibacter ostreae]KAB7885839.1 helix-turn-helix domain-containing protein [Poseidonibacter ostreae]KAB7887161.1 helix-turn-helix domain-containing protein [Poseidonibacter ostreae]